MYAENAEVVAPTGTYQGTEQIQASCQAFKTAFPDGQVQGINQVAAGDQVVTEAMLRVTHTGPLGTIPATGKAVAMPMAFVGNFRDGKVESERIYFDMAAMMRQLGLSS